MDAGWAERTDVAPKGAASSVCYYGSPDISCVIAVNRLPRPGCAWSLGMPFGQRDLTKFARACLAPAQQPQPFVETRLSQLSPASGSSSLLQKGEATRGSRAGRCVCHLTPWRIQSQTLKMRDSNSCYLPEQGEDTYREMRCRQMPLSNVSWPAGLPGSSPKLVLSLENVPWTRVWSQLGHSQLHLSMQPRCTLVHYRTLAEGSLKPCLLSLAELGGATFVLGLRLTNTLL